MMATGSGKTRTAIGLVDLLTTGRRLGEVGVVPSSDRVALVNQAR